MNHLKAKAQQGNVLLGTHITTRDAHHAEVMGTAGFDYFWIDMEHTELTKSDVYNILTAAKASKNPPACFVRVAENNPVLVKPLLDMGPDGIIFPLIKTVEDVERAIASCTYPPKGTRGFCPRRIINYGMDDMQEYLATVDERLWKIIQIETKEALDNFEEIIKNPDVNAFIIGPCDLSASLGHLMEIDHPVVAEAIDYIIRTARAAGRLVGVSIGAYDTESLRKWIDRGINMISSGGEIMYVYDGANATVKNFKKAIESE